MKKNNKILKFFSLFLICVLLAISVSAVNAVQNDKEESITVEVIEVNGEEVYAVRADALSFEAEETVESDGISYVVLNTISLTKTEVAAEDFSEYAVFTEDDATYVYISEVDKEDLPYGVTEDLVITIEEVDYVALSEIDIAEAENLDFVFYNEEYGIFVTYAWILDGVKTVYKYEDEDISVTVELSNSEDISNEAELAVTETEENLYLISFIEDEEEFYAEASVTVSARLSSGDVSSAVHITADGTEGDAEITDEGIITFATAELYSIKFEVEEETADGEAEETSEEETADGEAEETSEEETADGEDSGASEIYVYEYSDDDISVTVTLDDPDDIPDGAELAVEEAEVTEEYLEEINTIREKEYEEYRESVWEINPCTTLFDYEEIAEDDIILYDISFIYEGEEIEPADTVSVEMEYSEEKLDTIGAEAEDVFIIHFTDEGEAEMVESQEADGVISFETDSFSSYATQTVYITDSYSTAISFYCSTGNDGSMTKLTTYFYEQTIDGEIAFCLDPGYSSTSGDEVTYTGVSYGTDTAYSSIYTYYMKNIGTSNSAQLRAMCQVVYWCLSMGVSSTSYNSINQSIVNFLVASGIYTGATLTTIGETAQAILGTTGSYTLYVYRKDSSTQRLIVPVLESSYEGYINLKKASLYSDITSGNSNYSLVGAVYTVYSDSSCTNSLGTLTVTGSDGSTDGALTINLGTSESMTVYVVETTTPTGYLTNNTVYKETVEAGKTTWVGEDSETVVYDTPVWATFSLAKTDDDEDAVSGVIYVVKYYTSSSTSTVTKTWYLKTDSSGTISLDTSHLVNSSTYSSDSLYTTTSNTTGVLPLGSITVKEVYVPAGCQYDTKTYTGTVTASSESSTGAVFTWTYSGSDSTSSTGYLSSSGHHDYNMAIETELLNSNGTHIISSVEGTTLTDTITYTHFNTGSSYAYTVKGYLYDVTDSMSLVRTYTSPSSFYLTSTSGSFKITYTISDSQAVSLAGHTLVSYVYVYMNSVLQVYHTDSSDAEQSVYSPSIYTRLVHDYQKTDTGYSYYRSAIKTNEEILLYDLIYWDNNIPWGAYLRNTITIYNVLSDGTLQYVDSAYSYYTTYSSSDYASGSGGSVYYTYGYIRLNPIELYNHVSNDGYDAGDSIRFGGTVVAYCTVEMYVDGTWYLIAEHKDADDELEQLSIYDYGTVQIIKTTKKTTLDSEGNEVVTDEDVPVSGAVYEIYRYTDDDHTEYLYWGTGTTNDEGILVEDPDDDSLEGMYFLIIGDYFLIEVDAATGYTINDYIYEFTVDEVYTIADAVTVVSVTDDNWVKLPSSGGFGMWTILAGSIALVAIGTVLITKRRKRNNFVAF